MKDREIDANKVIESLQNRIGQLVAQYETDIAVRDALIATYEEENRE